MSLRASATFFCASQQLSRCQTVLPRLTALRRRQPVLARGGRKADGGGGDKAARPRRDKVDFLIPGHPPLRTAHVTQRMLNSMLIQIGAVGFEMADGRVSQDLEDLPEGGTVTVVMSPEIEISTAKQLRNLQASFDNSTRAKELEFEAFLRALASMENVSVPLTTLQTSPFKGVDGQDCVQLDAAIQAGQTLYLGEMKRVLSEVSVVNLNSKLGKIREALSIAASPDLAAALQGVNEVKLFLGGEVLRAGLPMHKMVDIAAARGMSLVLPSGQGLGLVASAAPAVKL